MALCGWSQHASIEDYSAFVICGDIKSRIWGIRTSDCELEWPGGMVRFFPEGPFIYVEWASFLLTSPFGRGLHALLAMI